MLAGLSLWIVAVVGLVTIAMLVLSSEPAVKKLMGPAGYFHLILLHMVYVTLRSVFLAVD